MCFTVNFWPLLIAGIANGFLYTLIALGYTLVYGVLQLINFAHSEVFMSGGFAGYFILNAAIPAGSTSTPHGAESVGLLAAAIIGGGVAGGIVAFLLERVAYRPLRRRRAPRLAFLISAIGASYFLYNLAGKEFGRFPISMPTVFTNGTVFSVFNGQVQTYYVLIGVAALAMLVFLDRVVPMTRLGRAIRAVSQDADTASLMGVNIDSTISKTFILGGLLARGRWVSFRPRLRRRLHDGIHSGSEGIHRSRVGRHRQRARRRARWAPPRHRREPRDRLHRDVLRRDVISFGILVLVLLSPPTGILGERLGRSA